MPSGLVRPSSEIEPIVGIQFGIFSPDEIEKRSVVEITNTGTYDGNEPRIGGLFDPRMGVLDNGKTCRSCGQTNHHCPGHFGHFRLARPVYYIQFFPLVLNVLSCVCIRCSKLLVDKSQHEKLSKRRGEARWRQMLSLTSNIGRCGQETEDGCGARQPDRYVRDGIARIVAEWDNIEGAGAPDKSDKVRKERQVLEVEYVLRLFRRITDEDVDFMGLSRFWCRPDWMICTVLAIPPPQVRPSVIQDNNQRSEDDLTHKLFEIVNTNNMLQDKINNNAVKNIVDEYTNVLQYHIATLVDNQIPGVAPSAQRSGRPLKSIQQRLGSKEGRIRYNIQGKRVEFSARSVITPDPNISVAEIGVPIKIAMNLTVPERVTSYNRDQMYKLIQNGADKYPGAKTLVRADGRMISLKHVNSKEIVLYYGDVVNRHLADGDTILFNRQPTLHRMSMMGHRVKVLPYNTFRLNVSVTSPYNADFDGDEMNAHIPQSIEAATELAEIAAVPHQIVTPRHAKPVIGVVQDSLVGSWRMTRSKVKFNRREFMNMMMWNKRFEGVVPPPASEGRFSGQQILSQLLPPINLEMGNSFMKDAKTSDEKRDNYIVIKEGKITQGIMDKDIFSKPSKGIVHTIFKDYGPTQTVNFIDAMQNTVEQFLVYNGFSVGISDLVADEDTRKEMDKVIKARKAEIENILLQLHLDLFDNNTGKTNHQEFEDKVYTELNKATEFAGKIGLSSLAEENRLIAMVRAGSKGSTINIAQMMACVGQQAPEGRRIPYGFSDRTLPHYKKYDDGAEARGFVESSFIQGLTPQEFFFHAMSGREGLIDTAVKTADTGYIQRQLVKAMEDLVIQFDGSVRDARNNILQFHYGEDGVNSTKIENLSIGLSKLTDADILTQYSAQGLDFTNVFVEGAMMSPEETAALDEFSRQVLQDRKMIVEDVNRNKDDAGTFASVNLERLILNTSVKFQLNKEAPTDLLPGYVIDGIKKVIYRTQKYNALWAAMLRFWLAPHKIIVKQRFTKAAFDTLLELIVLRNWQAWAQPGEQVGIIAAQSIGEPSTQMSAIYDTIIVISQPNGENYFGPIGAFVDTLLETHAASVVPLSEHSSLLDLSGYKIASVSKDEKVIWAPISQISRHHANGGLVKVVTKSGRTTTATLSHSFLKRSRRGIVPVLGSELKIGMRIPIARTIPEVPNVISKVHQGLTTFNLNYTFGWLCGIYLADGSLSGNTVQISKIHPIVERRLRAISAEYDWVFTTREHQGEYGPSKDNNIYSKDLKDFLNTHFKTGSYAKELSGAVFSYSNDFKRGVLGGYFDGDGNVNVERQQIRVGSRSEKLIRDINRLFGFVGFFTILGEESSVRIPGKVMWTLNVLKNDAREFRDEIGLKLPEKASALEQIIEYMDREDTHDTKELYDKIPEVGELIAETGRLLKMPGQSRTYGRWLKKESVGRTTLQNYVSDFNEMFEITKDSLSADTYDTVKTNLVALESAASAHVVWDEITDLIYLDDPKTFVYDFTVPGNESFMVDDCIMVHNTLNSVDWDTRIMIAKNGKILTPEIGDFVDTYYENTESDKVQRLPNEQIYIELNDGNDWKAISCDETGKMVWTKLEAITRHPVVNEDGSDTILEVTLQSGRSVKATKARSFLTCKDGRIHDTNGSDLKVGDKIPIANTLVLEQIGLMKSVSLRETLPPTEWMYGTDVEAALKALGGDDRMWFQKNQGTLFTIPYSRSDAFREAFVDGKNTNMIRAGFVYPKRTRPDVSQIPEDIPLTKEFGFFAGAYLAEGMANSMQVCITNNDDTYLEKVKLFMDAWNVGTHHVKEDTGIQGTSSSLIIHSTLIAKIMQEFFGRVSSEKTLPDWVFQAPDEFVSGLLDAYLSGDGTVEKKSGIISATSVSKELLQRLSTLLARYGIFATMTTRMPEVGVFESVRRNYTLHIPAKYSRLFSTIFTLSSSHKQAMLDTHFKTGHHGLRSSANESFEDVVCDTVKCIKEVKPIKTWVYDLTVEKTRNFMTDSCIAMKDTFHLAGVAAKSNVTRGVPRLKELLKVTKSPKAISLTVYLKPEFRHDKEKAREVCQDLELTLLKDVTVRAAIYYDPNDETTITDEGDKDLIAFYKAFEKSNGVASASGADASVSASAPAEQQDGEEEIWSRWMLRVELDRERLFAKNISMEDIAFVLRQRFDNEIHLIYSDFNSPRLIMRIRLPAIAKSGLDDLANLKKFVNRILNGIVIRGVTGLKSVKFREDKDLLEYKDGKYEKVTQYVLDTDGTNYQAAMSHPMVDGRRLVSSHVHDIFENLGIEATRAVLLNEIIALFESAGADVNFRHPGLLCDVMTRAGKLMSADRYGINKNDIGPLAKASFEETEKILLRAAVFGEVDPVTGVSANIMTGQVIRGGTAFSQILLDETALMRLQENLPPVEGLEEEEEGPTDEQVEDELHEDIDDMCSKTRLRMNITMPSEAVLVNEPDVEMVVLED